MSLYSDDVTTFSNRLPRRWSVKTPIQQKTSFFALFVEKASPDFFSSFSSVTVNQVLMHLAQIHFPPQTHPPEVHASVVKEASKLNPQKRKRPTRHTTQTRAITYGPSAARRPCQSRHDGAAPSPRRGKWVRPDGHCVPSYCLFRLCCHVGSSKGPAWCSCTPRQIHWTWMRRWRG